MRKYFTICISTFFLLVFSTMLHAQTTDTSRGNNPQSSERTEAASKEKKANRARSPKRLAAPMQPMATADGLTLNGCIIDSYSEDYWRGVGIYSFKTEYTTPDFSSVKLGVNAQFSGTYANGIYYAVDSSKRLHAYDVKNGWREISSDVLVSYEIYDMTFDPTTETIYITYPNESYTSVYFGTLDPTSGAMTKIGNPAEFDSHVRTLASTKEGDLYGVRFKDGQLMYVDKETGRMTEVGSVAPTVDGTKRKLYGFMSATFDWESGLMYWVPFFDNGDSALFSVALEGSGPTATVKEVKLLKDYGYESPNGTGTTENITGLFIEQEAVSQNAPNTVTELSAQFENGLLTGNVTFTMPTAYTNGTAIAGELEYTIAADDNTASGKALPGTTVNAPFTVKASGNYSIKVTAKDGSAESLPASITIYIGMDTPAAPSQASLAVSGQQATVTWAAPTTGANGGYINGLTYNVKRYPGGVSVAQGITKTTYTETIEDPARREYYYEVSALCNGKEGAPAQTNKALIGTALEPPYSETFDNASSVEGYTTIDVNLDGKRWQYCAEDNYEAQYRQNLFLPNNMSLNADDWVITPGFTLSAGNLYKFSMRVQSNLEQTFCVMMGNEANAEAMTTEIVPVTTYDGAYGTFTEFSGTCKPQANGTYFFGIHATSVANSSDMFIDDIQIEVVPATCPAMVENMAVTPGEKGALNATVTFNAPTRSINGNPLYNLTGVRLYRDNKLLETYNEVTPGQELRYEDDYLGTGMHAYKTVAYNADGAGESCIVKKFIGIDIPGPVRNLTVVEDWENEPGTMMVSWEAPEVGQNGGYIDPEGLTYYLFYTGGPEDQNLGNATSFRDKIDVSKGQQLAGYCIYATNVTGSGVYSRVVVSNVAGPSLQAPMYESFAGITLKSGPWTNLITNGKLGEVYWEIFDGSLTSAGTQDNDGGVAFFDTKKLGYSSLFRSPKIDIRGAATPALVFYLYHTGAQDFVNVRISTEFGPFNEVKRIAMNDMPNGWQRHEISLSDYKNSAFLQVGFEGVSVENTNKVFLLDNISVRDLVEHDLDAGDFTAPDRIKVGKEGTFTFVLKNHGTKEVKSGDYSVELYKNDRLATSVAGVDIPIDQNATITLTDVPTIDDSEISVYYVKVNYASDQVASNNQSKNRTVQITMPLYPTVNDLNATSAQSGIELVWSEPNIAEMPADPVSDSFESYKDFIIADIGKWTVVDGDGEKTLLLALDENNPLHYDNAGQPMAFQVFNPLAAGIPLNSWLPYSGNKMLVAISNSSGEDNVAKQNDDWLISPELNGLPQTISFFAKVAHAAAPEKFEVRYSTTDTQVSSFPEEQGTGVQTINNAKEWTEYRIDLPAGAKYFAIHYVSKGQMAFMLDNITYTPAGAIPEEIMLMGYNVYRDGQKLNNEPTGETLFTDTDVKEGTGYTYKVTAVYDKGESVYSNECTITYDLTGIQGITGNKISVTTGNGMITVTGAEGLPVKVTTTAGIRIYDAVGQSVTRIPATKGVHLLTIGKETFKVLVK